MDAMTRYYHAKECEESAVRYIEDAYIESVNSLEKLEGENAKLRELIFDMLVDEERGHNDDGTFYEHVRLAKELGIEVES